MTVLIVSSVSDVHAQAVMTALSVQGASVELIDTAEFPTSLALSMTFDGNRCFQLRRSGGGVLDLDIIDAVWWRRPQPFRLPIGMDPMEQEFAQSEATTAFQGLYQSLNAVWVNDPARDSAAAHKPYQLTVAQQIGLEIPLTLMTNDVDKAREFFRQHEGEVVYKQFLALQRSWRETRRLTREDEAHASSIAYAPVIFQRHVPAVADLRVTIVGDEVFAAATDVRDADYPQDVRLNPGAEYYPHELPPQITEKLHTLMQRLGLVYGAIDLRLTPEGRYVFLEINPAGQFLYIEQVTAQPIAAALARKLMDTSSF